MTVPGKPGLSRRAFLKTGLMAGAGLTLVGYWRNTKGVIARPAAGFSPSVWLDIDEQGTVTVAVAKAEMGQGITTSLPMLVAEELEASWKDVRFQLAPVTPAYGIQSTGGSSSIRDGWELLRRAGATARELLRQAAALHWSVPVDECRAETGKIIHIPTARTLYYGDLVERAASLPVPHHVSLKDNSEFNLIGRTLPRLDIPDKVTGRACFGMDINPPGALCAAIMHCPVFGGKLKRFREHADGRLPGVRKIIPLEAALAVVADDSWTAQQALNSLSIEWEPGPHVAFGTDTLELEARKRMDETGAVKRTEGDIDAVSGTVARKLHAEFVLPFQAHATMEPMCCVASVGDRHIDIWVPTQKPTAARDQAIATANMETGITEGEQASTPGTRKYLQENVVIHPTMLGGGFGRRRSQDYVAEAVQIARELPVPVKLLWSREEDVQHDRYREWSMHRIEAGIDKTGMLVSWRHRIAGPRVGSSGAHDLPYAVPNIEVSTINIDTPVPLGSWRSLAHSYNAYVTECFMDEIARATGKDPLEMRLQLLSGSPRHKAVLELAAVKSGWAGGLPEGRARGLAVHGSFGSFVAQVAEVSIVNNTVKVHRVVCAVDCGIAVDPGQVAAQMEGSVAFGLTAALKDAISVKNGRVEQANFHDFRLLRHDEMPLVETHIVKSHVSPTGVGEPGVPPIAAAVANAVFRLTGVMPRRLPIELRGHYP